MRNNKAALEDLLTELADNDAVVRENAIYLIGEIGAEAVALQLNTLKTNSQLRAINGLCDDQLRARVIDSLIALGEVDENPWLRGNIAEALGKIGDICGKSYLLNCLTDDDQLVRSSAAEALGSIGDASVVSDLALALLDDEWGVRLAATRSVGMLGGSGAVGLLQKCLLDARADVRIVAEDALEQLDAAGSLSKGG